MKYEEMSKLTTPIFTELGTTQPPLVLIKITKCKGGNNKPWFYDKKKLGYTIG